EKMRMKGEFARQSGSPYGMYRETFLGPKGTPCTPPPWGTTEAIDLFTGAKAWDVPLGSYVKGGHTGTVNFGGPIVTAGGGVVTAASVGNLNQPFDCGSGER